MTKRTVIIFFFVCCTFGGFSQDKLKYKIKKSKGYSIWELKYQPEYNNYELRRVYFKGNSIEYSRLSGIYHGVDLCYELDSSLYNLSRKKYGSSMEHYHFRRDTTMNVPVQNVLINGKFYEGLNGNLYMANRVSTKAIFIDTLCKEFENSHVFSSVCGTPFKGPYIYFLNTMKSKPLKRRDRKKMKLTTSVLKEIIFIECY